MDLNKPVKLALSFSYKIRLVDV